MAFDSTFRSPIPGSSLAHKMGDLPHEKPPKYVDPNEALEYFWKQFHRKDILKQLWYLFEQGATVWAIRRAILFKAVLDGIIQLNLALIIGQTIDQMLITLSSVKGIKGLKLNPKFRDKIAEAMLDAKMKELIGEPKGGTPIPASALRGMTVPPANNISAISQQGINSQPQLPQEEPQAPQQQEAQGEEQPQPQGQGLLGGLPQQQGT